MTKSLSIFLLIIVHHATAQLHLKFIPPQTDASFRGLSVVDDSVVWVSGSKGWVGRSANGGNTWSYKQIAGFAQNDFRTLYAFDARTAIIANAGSPAVILYTSDGGESWNEVYHNDDSAAFFDGIDFFGYNQGIIYGDPIQGRMLMLSTDDGGKSWKEWPQKFRPTLAVGEASFAASGTCIWCTHDKKVVIATGGAVSRLWWSNSKMLGWQKRATPILQGAPSRGIFSMALRDDDHGIIVGGDYTQDTLTRNNVFLTTNRGKTWIAPATPTRGYRECVAYLSGDTAIAVGPTGMDISEDGGMHWRPLSDEKQFHVVKKSRKGKLVVIAGGGGKIGLLAE